MSPPPPPPPQHTRLLSVWVCVLAVYFANVEATWAQATALSVDEKIDILLIAISAILVFIMQGGFALLESGMVRAKNSINVMMKNYIDMCVVMVVFWLVGYGLMWGENPTGFFGTTKFVLNTDDPFELINLFYQVMFAATAVTIISGALAERISFIAYIYISIFVSCVIYPVFGSWAWAEGGWLKEAGFIDFSGSTVVHSIGGWCALVAAIILGPRLGRFDREGLKRPILGHNLTLVALSGFLLWFGWFGFNIGSAAILDVSIPKILFNTNIAAACGGLAGVMTMLLLRRPILLTMTIAASIGGLVGITAGAATMSPVFAALTGLIGGIVSVFGIIALDKMRIDDVVGAVSCHAFAGFWGTLAAGIFYQGDMFNLDRIIIQIFGAVACIFWAFAGAFVLFAGFDKLYKIRVSAGSERRGLDFSEHNEIGYPEFHSEVINPGKTFN